MLASPIPVERWAACGDLSLELLLSISRQIADGPLIATVVIWSACMVLAMMAPGLVRPLAHIAAQSLPRRTNLLAACFIAVYTAVWFVAAFLLMLVAAQLVATVQTEAVALFVGLCGWYIWTCTPWQQLASIRAHAFSPLRSYGLKAVRDSCAFGFHHGLVCVASCWPLMLLPMLAGKFSFLGMALCTFAVAASRVQPKRRARWRRSGFLPTLMAAWLLVRVSLQCVVRACRSRPLATRLPSASVVKKGSS